jgi:two-component sensor histidine kinase
VIDTITANERYQYWTFQGIGWGGYVFFLLVSAFLYDRGDAVHTSYALAATLIGLMLSDAMHRVFKLVWDQPPIPRGLYTLLAVGVATGLWAFWKFYVYLDVYSYEKKLEHASTLGEYMGWYTYSFFILLSWAGLYYGIKYYRMAKEEQEKGLRIAAMAHQAQLKMLRYQLNPHFLFNTLNSISTLIMEHKQDVANRMVTGLSKFLRYTLDNDPMQKVTLAKEVEAMRLYLDIEKIRFEERLELDFQVEDKAAGALIPSMLLQPIVENSIKYAIARNERGGRIRIGARVFADELLLEISDDGPGIEDNGSRPESTGGVGLTNTRERLRVLYGDNQSCKFSNAEPHGVKVSIRIPYEA